MPLEEEKWFILANKIILYVLYYIAVVYTSG